MSSGFVASRRMITREGTLSESAPTADEPRCGQHGSPYSDATTMMPETDAAYGPTLFYCKIAANLASPETIRGSLRQLHSVICSVEELLGASLEYKAGGNDLVDSTTEMALSEKCWPQGRPTNDRSTEIESVNLTDLVATELDGDTDGWQKKLAFTGDVGNYTVYFFNHDGKIGVKKIDSGTAPGIGGVNTITLDTTNGVLLANMIDDRNKTGDAYRRLMRLRVTGTVTANEGFTSVDKLEGYLINSSAGFDANDTADNDYFGASVMGTAATGYIYKSMMRGSGTDVVRATFCSNTDTACAGVTPLVFAGGVGGFFNDNTQWLTYITTSMPMCDNGNSVTLNPMPVSGPLGVCAP